MHRIPPQYVAQAFLPAPSAFVPTFGELLPIQERRHECRRGRRECLRHISFGRREFLAFLAAACKPAAAAAPVRIYLLAGQSNMSGRADAADLPPDLREPRADILFYYECGFGNDKAPPFCSNGWIPLQPCHKHPSTPGPHFGPEITFGRAMAPRHKDRKIALIKMGRGSTLLASDWMPDLTGEHLYSRFLKLVGEATGRFRAAGTNFEIGGMVWMQGEGDSTRKPAADAYESNLRRFVSRVRQDLNRPGLPFVIGLSGAPGERTPYAEIVRAAQRKVGADLHNGTVETDDLTWLPDKVHLDSRAQIAMGNRFADAVAILEGEAPQTPPLPPIPPEHTTPPAGAKVHRNLVFAKTPQRELRLDLYVPGSGKRPFPVLIYLHGGGWTNGTKANPPAMRFVRQGFVVASIEHRLSQEAKFPAQIYDCKAAVRWLRASARQYDLDANRIGVWGGSSGGHLAALMGTSGDVRELEGDVGVTGFSSRVQAAVDFFGPTDFFKIAAEAKMDNATVRAVALVGGPLEEHRKAVISANPITWVSKDDPPMLIVHGDQDIVVPPSQSAMLFQALKAAGVDVEYRLIPGRPHGFRIDPEVDPIVDAFLAKHLMRRP